MPPKKNMLEAFQRSESTAPPAGAPPSSASGGGPSMPLFDRPATGDGGPRPLGALVAVGLVLAFVLGFALGRGTAGEARAEEKDAAPLPAPHEPPANQPRAFQERAAPGAPTAQTNTPPERLEESALFDRGNTSTVVVAAYSKTQQDLAWATYEHLREARLDAFPPVASGNLVVVLVGAAAKDSDLEASKNAVRALVRDGKKVYADAYIARIDQLIPRTNTKGNP